jgi:hypothetical protein
LCDQVFTTKGNRDSHVRNVCSQEVSVVGRDGQPVVIQRVNEKFSCKCGRKFGRSNHFKSHWKACLDPATGMLHSDEVSNDRDG